MVKMPYPLRLAAACLLFGACDSPLPNLPAEPVPDALSVSFLLQHGGGTPDFSEPTPAERVYGFIGEVSDPGEVYLAPVLDATASINGTPLQVRDDSTLAWYDGASRPLEAKYNYFTDSLAVEPGAEYTLVVERSDMLLQATTRVPRDYALLSVNGGTLQDAGVPAGEPLRLTWSKAEGAAVYAVWIEQPAGAPPLGVLAEQPYLTGDTTAALPFSYSQRGRVPVVIEIRAMDQNAYRAATLNDATAGIEGGYGFFGSANVKRYQLDLEVNR